MDTKQACEIIRKPTKEYIFWSNIHLEIVKYKILHFLLLIEVGTSPHIFQDINIRSEIIMVC